VPGIEDFRSVNNQGDLIFGARAALDLSDQSTLTLLVNNLTNREYSLRPGKMDAPRTMAVQYRMAF
jgi:outer membrane receptor protein involved in Fe transport